LPVTPIDIGRYAPREIVSIWEETSKLNYQLLVEGALARAHAQVGNIPSEAADEIWAKATGGKVSVDRVKQIESEIRHDVMAMVMALTEQCEKDAGRYVHLGATSNDITDTALSMQMRDSIELILSKCREVRDILLDKAVERKGLVCIGRTHGQHAIPTTYGLKFALWACEMQRQIERLEEAKKRICVGKMTGAVGTQAALGENGIKIQRIVMELLGLGEPLVTNQILQRDRHAEYMFCLAQIATTLDKIFTEVRNLQRTEIGELMEPFGAKQVGSSTMPSKRNPIRSERICGLSRVIRAMVEPQLLSNVLWHERDLTNSSCERVIIPEATIYLYYALCISAEVLSGLVFDEEKIEQNLGLTKGLIMAERVMIRLVEKGVGRQEAHAMVRDASMRAIAEDMDMAHSLASDPKVTRYLDRKEIDELMNPKTYIGTALEQVDRVVRLARDSWGYKG